MTFPKGIGLCNFKDLIFKKVTLTCAHISKLLFLDVNTEFCIVLVSEWQMRYYQKDLLLQKLRSAMKKLVTLPVSNRFNTPSNLLNV